MAIHNLRRQFSMKPVVRQKDSSVQLKCSTTNTKSHQPPTNIRVVPGRCQPAGADFDLATGLRRGTEDLFELVLKPVDFLFQISGMAKLTREKVIERIIHRAQF